MLLHLLGVMGFTYKNVQAYLEQSNMEKNHAWTTENEVLVAGKLFHRGIVVHILLNQLQFFSEVTMLLSQWKFISAFKSLFSFGHFAGKLLNAMIFI